MLNLAVKLIWQQVFDMNHNNSSTLDIASINLTSTHHSQPSFQRSVLGDDLWQPDVGSLCSAIEESRSVADGELGIYTGPGRSLTPGPAKTGNRSLGPERGQLDVVAGLLPVRSRA